MEKQKEVQSHEQIVLSIMALRDEMFATGKKEIGWKINSCIFKKYPTETQRYAN